MDRCRIYVGALLAATLFLGSCQGSAQPEAPGSARDKRKWVSTPPPDLDILQVTQAPLPPPPPPAPQTLPFDVTIRALAAPSRPVAIRLHADDRRLTTDPYPQSDPLVIRSMLGLAREFGLNPGSRYLPLAINHLAKHPFLPDSYFSSRGSSVVLTLTTPRERAVEGQNNNEGNVLEVAVFDDPYTVLPDNTPGQTWTAFGYILLRRYKADSNGNPLPPRQIRCYFLREDSNAVQRPMTEEKLGPGLAIALSQGYLQFDRAVRGLDSSAEEVRFFTGATTWQ